MKFLHTSDWHVGKTLKGRSRLAEQEAVLKEIVDLAGAEQFDAVLIAGDLYDTSAPSAEAQQLLVRALMALRRTGAEVTAMAGNHDHAPTMEAYRPLMHAAGIHLLGHPKAAGAGGVVSFTARSTGERVEVAVLPFVSQRYAIKAAELLTGTPADNAGRYDQRIRDMLTQLATGFTPGAVHLVMAHLTVVGAEFGGGERKAQSIFEYTVPASVFGPDPHYVALGHLHRRQSLPALCPVHYSGAPFAVDFGEQDNTPTVLFVDASPSTPAIVVDKVLTAGRRLRTVRGTVDELLARAGEFGDDYLRVYVTERTRAGLVDELRNGLPNAMEIKIDPDFTADPAATVPRAQLDRQSPAELFSSYLAERAVDDPRLLALFNELHDQLTSDDGARQTAGTGVAR